MIEEHRLKEWLERANEDIERSYAENHAKARDSSRVQQVGHSAERAWGALLEAWLPPPYEVAYRRYILPEVGIEDYKPRETDIVVLRPGYPRAVRAYPDVLAAGVAVAFSVKLTLDPKGLGEAVEEAAHVRRHLQPRLGTPRRETTLPFRYGLLAHGHRLGLDPHAKVASSYMAADLEYSEHPRLSLDMVCVANLGFWSKLTGTWGPVGVGTAMPPPSEWRPTTALMAATTKYSVPSSDVWPPASDLSPLALMVSQVYRFLAAEDTSAEPFADGLLSSGITPSSQGWPRVWSPDIYSEAMRQELPQRIRNGRDPEWSMSY